MELEPAPTQFVNKHLTICQINWIGQFCKMVECSFTN